MDKKAEPVTRQAEVILACAGDPSVAKIAQELKAELVDLWYGPWELGSDEEWKTRFEDELDACNTCLVFVENEAVAAPEAVEEVKRRADEDPGFRVIVIRLPVATPEHRSSQVTPS